jgi:hypothetical protein
MYDGFLCCVCGLISVELMGVLMILLYGLGQFYFESCSQFFSSHFPVTTLGLDPFSGAYLNKFTVCVVSSHRIGIVLL